PLQRCLLGLRTGGAVRSSCLAGRQTSAAPVAGPGCDEHGRSEPINVLRSAGLMDALLLFLPQTLKRKAAARPMAFRIRATNLASTTPCDSGTIIGSAAISSTQRQTIL